ncbi:MAG TPA: hypothetical protein ENJ89_07380 [Caldithrix abyssi]|uniref:Uncharacterized protein n=1 Tax=Caldithrix abyssi TaxID=187145 RepID=A0A7V5PQ13_CALAY|nr:hypothetical protein [Caldithrix abyssi]
MRKLMILFFGVSLLWLVSCQRNTTGNDNQPDAETMAAIQTVLEDSADIFYDGLDDQSEDNIDVDNPSWTGGVNLGKTAAKSRIHFGRIASHPEERSIQITLDTDSTATAYIHTKFVGRFVVHKFYADSDSVAFEKYTKPMTHEVQRIVHLRKVRDTGKPRQDWKIKDVSMTYGASPNNTVEIVKLEVMPSGYDSVTVTDPLDYFMNGSNVFSFARFTKIKLRVTVSNTTANPVIYPEGTQATEAVRLIYGRNRKGHFARSWFKWVGQDANGNNIYEGDWTVYQFRGMHHAIIDVVDNGTVLDPDDEKYPYNSVTWSTPYRVTIF